jgi:hypothetical protein
VVYSRGKTMTQNKDLKRLVRARMKKTGEAYTAARAQITAKPKAKSPAPVAIPVAPPSDYAALAGMSDESVKAKTGCTWDRWVRALDHHGAEQMSHRDIAALVNSKYKIDRWWSQSVVVGYERIKGLRVRGQGRNGRFEATKSRTFDVPVTRLFEAWADPTARRRWLNGAGVKVRTATAPKSIRLDWSDGDMSGIVAVGFTAKGRSKSAVALAHAKLPDRETADRLKQYWSERLDALGEVLT